MDKKESATKSKGHKAFRKNQYGKRIIVNWCYYANVLAKREHAKLKKNVVVSKITEDDKKVFKKAYEQLKKDKMKKLGETRKELKRLASSRSMRGLAEPPIEVPQVDSNYVYCPIDYEAERAKTRPPPTPKSSSKYAKPKAVVRLSKLRRVKIAKTEPEVPPKPKVVIPPFKTRPWDPCAIKRKVVVKPVIDYPPVTLRTT